MTTRELKRAANLVVVSTVCLVAGCSTTAPTYASRRALRSTLTFHASFDHGVDADFARGDRKLYLNGELRGTLPPREQTFTWHPSQTLAMLGLNYIGLFDELAFFSRALTDAEVKLLFQLEDGVWSLHNRYASEPLPGLFSQAASR